MYMIGIFKDNQIVGYVTYMNVNENNQIEISYSESIFGNRNYDGPDAEFPLMYDEDGIENVEKTINLINEMFESDGYSLSLVEFDNIKG